MPKRLINISGFDGVDATTDPYILGKDGENSKKSVLSYNFRAKNRVRVGRNGYQTVVDGSAFKRSGVYFPYGARSIVPLTVLGDTSDPQMRTCFYCCNTTAFTIEFKYRARYEAYERVVCRIPVNLPNTTTRHMNVNFVPSDDYSGICHLELQFAVDTGSIEQTWYAWDEEIPMDNEWHHIALVRAADGDSITLYIDAESPGYAYNSSSNHETDPIPDWEDFLEQSTEPLWYNYLQLGDSNLSLAEFRIWNKVRSLSYLAAYEDVQLTGNEDGLVCYVPFDEGNGKYFEEKVNSARGYFSPQEPYVNDDNELVFTGYNCMAFPSLRARYDLHDYDNFDFDADFSHASKDGAFQGGILWDQYLAAETVDADADRSVPYMGVAQIRFRLRQLKEGIICGRLGILYNESINKYTLIFYYGDTAAGTNAVNDEIWQSNGDPAGYVDETWIGVEKTVTIFYNGMHDPNPYVYMFVDDTEVEVVLPVPTPTWSSGDRMNDASYLAFGNSDLGSTTDIYGDQEIDGAIGGSPNINNFCIAFDLIFLRQWVEEFPAYDAIADFVAATYDVEDLEDKFKVYATGVSGYLPHNVQGGQAYFTTTDYLPLYDASDEYKQLQYIRIPFNMHSDTFEMNGDKSFFYFTTLTSRIPKQDVVVFRVMRWTALGCHLLYEPDGSASPDYERWRWLTTNETPMGDKWPFNGATISNLVNNYFSETFEKNKITRPIYWKEEFDSADGISDATVEDKSLNFFEAIVDDSLLQGSESVGGTYYDSRYLILTALGSRNDTIYNQKSMRVQWCDGPIAYENANLPAVRGIVRYTSEDGKTNKLLVLMDCTLWTIDASTGTAEANEYGWMDRNSDTPVNMLTLNNRLIVMDDKSAIKMNLKGKCSHLGVERPMQIMLNDVDSEAYDTFVDGERYGYAAQFYDSENDAYSGTLPVYSDNGQQVKITGDSSSAGVDFLEFVIRTCRSQNVDRFRVYRTTDLEDTGTSGLLYLVKDGILSKKDATCVFRDIWVDAQLTDQAVLGINYYGADLVPSPSGVMGQAYGRLFTFGTDDAEATLRWSGVDALGFGKPDEFHPLDALIVEEGGTTSGTALIEYNNVLYAFKEDSIFKVVQYSPGAFSADILYRGVGALNQRCVVMAGDSIMFLDRTGLYGYRGGEPQMLSTELVDYFKTRVNANQITRSFILHNKAEEQILAFVPGANSTYPDRCVVYDLRTGLFTIDLIPTVTCGYIDDTTIYLGTPYGKILKYDSTSYLDLVDTEIAEAATVSGLTVTSTGNFPDDGSTLGARLFYYDSSQHIWTGTVSTEVSANAVTVVRWEPIFNTTSTTPTASGTVMLGHLFFYDKSPVYSFFEPSRDKVLHEYSLVSNRVTAASVLLFYHMDFNDEGHTNDGYKVLSGYLNDIEAAFKGGHRNFQIENGGFYNDEFVLKELVYSLTYTAGRKDY